MEILQLVLPEHLLLSLHLGTNDGVKYSSSGGIDAWNTSEYMNIWVCDISGGILGYAQFPGGNSSSDGIVCDYAYFGNTGTATSPYN